MTWQKESADASDIGAQRRKETATIHRIAGALVWSIGVLLMNSAAYGQTLLAELHLNHPKNSMVQVSVRLTATDPHENTETYECARITSSDGSLNETLCGRWGTDQTFPAFRAQTSDIDVWCTGVEIDGDEGCTLAATINGNPAYTPEMKALAARMTLGLSMAGAVMGASLPIICPLGPQGLAACVMVGISGAGIGLMALRTNKIAGDPPQWDYWVVAEPIFGIVPLFTTSMGITREQADTANWMLSELRAADGYMSASLISADRAVGAHEAGDINWEQVQLDYSAHYMRVASSHVWSLSDSLDNVAQEWRSTITTFPQTTIDQRLQDFNWQMFNPSSFEWTTINNHLINLGVSDEHREEVRMSLMLAMFPPTVSCLDCEGLPSKDGFASFYWVQQQLSALATEMANTYSLQILPPPPDPVQWVLPSWPSCDWYWWQRPDVWNAWPGDCNAAWNHYLYYHHGQDNGTYWNWAWGMVCNRAAEIYFQLHPDVRVNPYFGQGMWQAFDHFQWYGVWESWNYNWPGEACQ